MIFCFCNFFSFCPSILLFLPCLSLSLSLSHPCLSTYLSLPLLSLHLSFSHPCLSFSLFSPDLVSLSIFLSPIHVIPLSYSHSCLPVYLSLTSVSLLIFLSPTMPLFFSGSLSPIPVSLFLLSLSFYLSRTPVSLPISLSLSLPLLSLLFSLSVAVSLSLSLSVSFCRTPVFLLIFLSHTLSPFLSFVSFSLPSLSRSLSHPCLSLSLFFLTLVYFSRSLSPIPVSLPLSFTFSNPYFSLSLLSLFPSFLSPVPVLFLSSPTHVSLSIFVSPLSLLLPLSSAPISLPTFLTPTDVSFFYILLSRFLSRQPLSLSPSKEREHKIILKYRKRKFVAHFQFLSINKSLN